MFQETATIDSFHSLVSDFGKQAIRESWIIEIFRPINSGARCASVFVVKSLYVALFLITFVEVKSVTESDAVS